MGRKGYILLTLYFSGLKDMKVSLLPNLDIFKLDTAITNKKS